MATSQPSSSPQQPSQSPPLSTPTPTPTPGQKTEVPPWARYTAMAAVVLGPIALFTPPRRVGFQALFLSTGTFYATNILAYDFTGESIYQRFVRRWDNAMDGSLPEKARRTQEMMRRERDRREAALPEEQRRALQEERERKELAARGPLSRLWMGNEKESWKEERAKREKEALEEGKGYGDLIIEQVKEVFGSEKEGQGKTEAKAEDDQKK